MVKIQNAVISVYNKKRITTLAQFLSENKIAIYASSGTLKELKKKNIKASPISKLTKAKEILGGRVKSIDYRLAAGILACPDKKREMSILKEIESKPIGLVVVNFYPFYEKVRPGKTALKDALELIDIGGVSLARAAAKNFENVVVLVDPEDYSIFIKVFKENDGEIPHSFRMHLATKAFAYCSKYDEAIFEYFSKTSGVEIVPEEEKKEDKVKKKPTSMTKKLNLALVSERVLRYGENPHQQAVLYKPQNLQAFDYRILQGRELSYNNILDANTAFKLTAMPYSKPYVACVIKHTIPCGAAISDDPLDAIIKAREGDPISAFGGIVGTNFEIDETLAKEIAKGFVEVVVAPSFTLGAVQVFTRKRRLRLLEVDRKAYEERVNLVSSYNEGKAKADLAFVRTAFGLLVQEEDLKIAKPEEVEVVSDTPLRAKYKEDVYFGLRIIRFVKSNGVIVVKDGMLVGVGAGQTSRVAATKLAVEKAGKRANDAVLVSDGFFPFADSVEYAASGKIAVIAAPSGSIRDHEIIQKANELDVCLLFIPTRHFAHT